MKTLENISADRLFIIVRNMGIQSDILITDKKHLGAMVASMLYGANAGLKTYNVLVSDIAKKTARELGFNSGKSYVSRFSINPRNENYRNLMEYINNKENQYDITECISSYKFKPFYLFMIQRNSEKLIMKGNDPFKMEDYCKNKKDFKVIVTARCNQLDIMSYLAIYDRFTGKETEDECPYHSLSGKSFNYLLNKINEPVAENA